jgi:hypothetical protein
MFTAGSRAERLVLDELRRTLTALRPGAGWVSDEQETVPLPDGEW